METPLTNHYFDVTFGSVAEQLEQPTPLWDGLLRLQMDEETKVFLEGMLGRLFYPLKALDDWQVLVMLKGDGGTGKGTVLSLVTAMFPDRDVGTITSTFEQKFGLHPLYTKRLVTVPDMPRDIASVLDQQLFQSMVSGDDVPVPRKNVMALPKVPWRVAMLWASNYLMNNNDPGGAISRRVLVFLFENKVLKSGDTLAARIKRDELVAVLVRCLVAYRDLRERLAGLDFYRRLCC